MRLFISLMLAALSLSACGTSYRQPILGLGGGYGDRQLGEGRWRVAFGGNAYTRSSFALNAALYRGAELADRAGYPYFQIVQSSLILGDFAEGRGYEPAAGQHLTEPLVHFTVQGVRDADAPLNCENNYRRGCRTLATAEVLRQLQPIVRPSRPGRN